MRTAVYRKRDFRFSYLRTKDDAEVDLVIERPGQKLLLIEIKSATMVMPDHYRTVSAMAKELNADAVCLCNETVARQVGNVTILPWRQGVLEI
jgi:hypothetical protein